MNMNFDISHLLEQWDYQPGQVVVRRFMGKDGNEKIQLRVDLGILQMNSEGRPDGKRPVGYPSLFEFYLKKFSRTLNAVDSSNEEFGLKPEDCAKLQLEALQYHHRSICFLQLEDYPAVARDTERNLKVFDFVAEHAESEELGWSLEQFRPQVLMLNTRARATEKLLAEQFNSAVEIIDEGIEQLKEFYLKYSRAELLDQSPEIQSLQLWREEVLKNKPLSKREKLESDLREAVKQEDYEKAAKVRDALKNLGAE